MKIPQKSSAIIHVGVKSLIRAEKALEIADKIFLDRAKVFAKAGMVKKWEGEYLGALLDFNLAIECYPLYFGCYTERVEIMNFCLDYESIILECNRAIIFWPNSYYLHFLRANANYSLKNHASALEDYTFALSQYPKSYVGDAIYKIIYRNRAYQKKALKDYLGAIEDFNKLIEICQENDDIFYRQAIEGLEEVKNKLIT